MTLFRQISGPGHFRVLLAALVVVSHMSSVEIGRPAVFVFFMLSGYWVLRMYEQKYRPAAPVWVFYLSRIMRVWLAFATAFLAVFLLYALSSDPRPPETLAGLSLFGLSLFGLASNRLSGASLAAGFNPGQDRDAGRHSCCFSGILCHRRSGVGACAAQGGP